MLELLHYLLNAVMELMTAQILSGFTGATTRGKPYYVDDSDALQELDSTIDVFGKIWGIGTGNTGQIQIRGTMRGLGTMTAGTAWVAGAHGLAWGMPPGPFSHGVGIVRVNVKTTLHIDIHFVMPTMG